MQEPFALLLGQLRLAVLLESQLYQAGPRRETLGVYAETINTESKVLYQIAAIHTLLRRN